MLVRRYCLMTALLLGLIGGVIHPANADVSASNKLGFQFSYLEYTEPNIEISGPLPGVQGELTPYRSKSLALELDGRVSAGELGYDGQTLETDPKPVTTTTDNLLINGELKARFPEGYPNSEISPFFGVGYRYWENDIKDSSDVSGFLREVEYLYAPFGFGTSIGKGRGWNSRLNVAYRFFLEGTVRSHLSDANSSFPDVKNTQDDGDGVHVNYSYRRRTQFGSDYNLEVFLNYWDIGRSDVVATGSDIDGDGSNDSVFEPKNETTEVGARLSVNF